MDPLPMDPPLLRRGKQVDVIPAWPVQGLAGFGLLQAESPSFSQDVGLLPIPGKAIALSDTSVCSEEFPDAQISSSPLPFSHFTSAALPPSASPPSFLPLGQVGKRESACGQRKNSLWQTWS